MLLTQLLKKLSKYFKVSFVGRFSTPVKLTILVCIAALIRYLFRSKSSPPISKMSISQFLHPFNKSVLQKVNIHPGILKASDKFGNVIKSEYGAMPANLLYNQIKGSAAASLAYVGAQTNSSLDFLLLLISITSGLLIYFLYKKSNQNRKPSKPVHKVMFDDIVGLDSAKIALKEAFDFMIRPDKYQSRGARMRRGVLLYGPPGTGKTTLAKACANQAGIPFYSCNAAEFCQIYVGVGPKKVRQLFATARQNSPSVIFIDELDALGSRSGQNSFIFESAHSQKNSTINQILSQIDGFNTNDKVLVIGATNRVEMVDKSLVRSGRFDLKINVPLPPLEMKVKIFRKYLDKTKNNISDEFISKLMEKSDHGSGADIQALVNQAIYLSMRRGSAAVSEEDILSVSKQGSA